VRLATYRGPDGSPRGAAVVDDDVVDLGAGVLDILQGGPTALDAARATAAEGPRVPLTDVRLLAPLPRPPKLIAAAANYQAHIVEGGLPPVDKSRIVPKLFIKPSSAIIGPDEPLRLPTLSDTVDWELELAVVIGAGGKDIPVTDALAAVAGYTIVNDVSARSLRWDLDDRQPTNFDAFFDWLNGKWLDGFAPMGPWIVTADEVPDPDALPLRLTVNGKVCQEASTGDMIFGTAELVAFASRIMTLEPGDVIATGTPAGVGDTTGVYLRPGDVMEGTIGDLGMLRTPVGDLR
jgi:2-keto-4-pentenoate hydratase/2-oxohepta-3-ene-1,7-dioic acid hydratase in catechol pathway